MAKAGGKQAKRPTPASTPKRNETSPRDNMPPKKKKEKDKKEKKKKDKKKGVVCQVANYMKTPWEGKPDGDGAAAGRSRQQAGSSKRRTSDWMPTE